MPRAQQLPEVLAPLSRRNAIEISDTRFHHDVDRLIEALEKQAAAPAPVATRPGDSVQERIPSPRETPQQTVLGPPQSSQSTKTAIHASPPLSAERPVAPDVVEQAEIQREGEQVTGSGAEQFTRRRLLMIAASIGAVLIVALGSGPVRHQFAAWFGPSLDDRARELDAWVEAFKKENPAATKADLDFAYGELYRLGEYRGLSRGRDWLLATSAYADAAREGHIGAHIQLANLFREGTGVFQAGGRRSGEVLPGPCQKWRQERRTIACPRVQSRTGRCPEPCRGDAVGHGCCRAGDRLFGISRSRDVSPGFGR